ncbi:cytochrome b [Iodobacter fluviatilis]|uniref:Cytochrome b561 n=1 Tax=Iodobacter fluviatilis TaxID=537 RepID=A0A377Q554_9NEIS|nr:cytochrome b [Iodobacter fluviatilis]TCU84482.1 cytochrome b561 [Iodobacter fluviatilis]STQ89947.1 Cytochrome b561 homolog 2 [Iodobacter fluviatilis]
MSKQHYDSIQVLLHWLVAILIFVAFGLAWTMDDMPLSPTKFKIISWHKWAGITVLGLVAIRLIWLKLKGAPPADPSLPALQRKLSAGVHHLLYLLMFAMPLSGWLMSSAKGFPVVYLGLWKLPDLVAKNEGLSDTLKNSHELFATALLILIGLHIAAALKHHFIDKDTILARMIPFLRKK